MSRLRYIGNTSKLDQLAWEIILRNCVDEDLIIVSADSDWQDRIDLRFGFEEAGDKGAVYLAEEGVWGNTG